MMLLPAWLPSPMSLPEGGGSSSGGSLSRGVTPPQSGKRAVRTLLECFLAFSATNPIDMID